MLDKRMGIVNFEQQKAFLIDMEKKDESVGLIEVLLESVKGIGVKGTIEALTQYQSDNVSLSDMNVDFTLKMISAHYKIPVPEIIDSKNKSVKRRTAIAFAVYYLYEVFDYGLTELRHVLGRHKSHLSRLNKMIKNEFAKKNKELIHIKNKFDLEINTFNLAKNK